MTTKSFQDRGQRTRRRVPADAAADAPALEAALLRVSAGPRDLAAAIAGRFQPLVEAADDAAPAPLAYLAADAARRAA